MRQFLWEFCAKRKLHTQTATRFEYGSDGESAEGQAEHRHAAAAGSWRRTTPPCPDQRPATGWRIPTFRNNGGCCSETEVSEQLY
jgi:hypothetical protein